MTDIIIVICQLLMVPGGWWIVHHLSIRRERQSEWRKLAMGATGDVEKIEELALSYHKSRTRNIEHEEEIIKRLERLQNKIDILCGHLRTINKQYFIAFRQAITMNNFQSNQFTCQPAGSEILKSIMATATQLIGTLYTAH